MELGHIAEITIIQICAVILPRPLRLCTDDLKNRYSETSYLALTKHLLSLYGKNIEICIVY